MTDMFQFIWDEMQKEKQRVNQMFETVNAEIDAATETKSQAVADLPLAADGMSSYELRFATDGLKQGETTGIVTGKHAVFLFAFHPK